MDPLRRDAFARQILVGRALGGVEQIGDLVREHAIDLFGHGAVVAAQPRLDMRDGNVLLGGNQAAREGRVDVADDYNA